MKKDPLVYIKHIRDCVEILERYTKGLTKQRLLEDSLIQDAITRRMEIIGEATKNIPLEFKKVYPEISWKKMAGMRDVMIHKYLDVDLDVMWDVLKKDIPILKKHIKRILKENG